jgi:hypothetical protein
MKKRVVREFLNLPEECAISTNVCSTVKWENKFNHYTIDISDPYNRVSLEGNFLDKKSYKNALHQIDTLMAVLAQTKQNIQEAREEYLKILEDYEKGREKAFQNPLP